LISAHNAGAISAIKNQFILIILSERVGLKDIPQAFQLLISALAGHMAIELSQIDS